MKKKYIQPSILEVKIDAMPIMAGSEKIDTSEKQASEWGARTNTWEKANSVWDDEDEE